jgi:ribosomal protein S21
MGRGFPTHYSLFYLKEGANMALDVFLHDGESQDSLIRRFQRCIQMEGILREFRANQSFLCKRDAFIIKSRRAARRKRTGR